MSTTTLERQLHTWKKSLDKLPDDSEHEHDRTMITKHIERLEAHIDLGQFSPETSYPGTRRSPDGDASLTLARFAKAKAVSAVDQIPVEKAAVKLYGSTIGGLVLKAADPVLSSEVPTAPGVQDFVELLRADSLYDKLAFRHVSPYVPIAAQTVQATAAFVGEGTTAAHSKWEAETLTLTPKKLVSLVPATIESIRDSSVQADRELTRDMLGAIRNTTDSVMLGTANSSAHAPAGLLYNITPVVSSGVDADDLQSDLKGLIGQIDPLLVQGVQLIMNPLLAFHIAMMKNDLGNRAFPGIGINGGELEGVPVVVSNAVAMGRIVAIVASEIYSIGDRGVEIAISNSATIGGDNAFANAFLAFRAIRPVSWAFRRGNTIAYLTGATYGETASPTAS